MSVQVRKIQKKDKASFVKLSLGLTKFNKRQHQKFHPDSQKVLKVRKKRVEERFDKLAQSPHLVVFMAFVDGQPGGYIRAFTYDKTFRYGCLDELYLTKKARGKGVGKKLLQAATRWMANRQVVRMIVSVYSWNASARKFYEEAGFCEYARSYEKPIAKTFKKL